MYCGLNYCPNAQDQEATLEQATESFETFAAARTAKENRSHAVSNSGLQVLVLICLIVMAGCGSAVALFVNAVKRLGIFFLELV